jgi:hypothetical protein
MLSVTSKRCLGFVYRMGKPDFNQQLSMIINGHDVWSKFSDGVFGSGISNRNSLERDLDGVAVVD